VLVFFDDILIYSSTWGEHLQHVRLILQTLRHNKLAVKQSKCSFGASSINYLGHIISNGVVAMDPAKVEAVQEWPRPTTVKALRGFLGLTGYYRKFIQNYGLVARPLTQLLKKEAFTWNTNAEQAFITLKQALVEGPALQLPNFDDAFIVNCDASGTGFGAVLHQDNRSIAFYSRPITPQHAKLAAYERELIGLVRAVRHWRPYLWARSFMVRTDHFALKYLLDQRLSTIPQHTWVSKLFGYDFHVEYLPGKANTAFNALPCHDEHSAMALPLSSPTFELYNELREELSHLEEATQLKEKIEKGEAAAGWTVLDGLLIHSGRIFVPTVSGLWPTILATAHGTGYEGIQKTLHHLHASFCNTSAAQLVKTSSRVARCAKGTSRNIFIRPAYYSPSSFRGRCG
jgi:hypothetical protein